MPTITRTSWKTMRLSRGAEQTIAENEDVKIASHDLLSQIFTDDFLAKAGRRRTYAWYNTLSMAPKGGES